MIIVRVLLQTVGLALGQIRANMFRAFLTSLGIILGVSSVIAVVAALTGMKTGVLNEVESFGAKKMWIWGQVPREKRGILDWDEVLITGEEADGIREHSTAIDRVTRLANLAKDVQVGDIVKTGVTVTGIEPDWHDIENRYVVLGRPLSTSDDENAQQVCLINDKAIEEFNLDRDPIGDTILIGGRRFLIVGLLETKDVGAMFGGGETLTEVYVPFSTAERLEPFIWPYMMAQVISPDRAEEARSEVRFVLRTMRGLPPEDEDTFGIEVMQSHIDQFNALAAGITAVAGGVVSISLLVGGIGIMNIMLVSVSERTREIGLRKAVGARPAVILLQFLTEAVTLSLVGGIVGLALGQVLIEAVKGIPNANLDEAFAPAWAIGMALAFSAGVGVIFGTFPAIKASRLDPIVALRKD